MSKMSKVIAMILIIAAVVFVAGCANKEAPAPANNTTTVNTEETNKSVVTSAENNTSAGMPAETNVSTVTTETNTTDTNITGNITENNTSVTVTHKSTTELNKEKILANANNSTSQ